jgi:hypothetical protein
MEQLVARVRKLFLIRRQQRELRAALTQLESDIERVTRLTMRLSDVVQRVTRVEALHQADEGVEQLSVCHALDGKTERRHTKSPDS